METKYFLLGDCRPVKLAGNTVEAWSWEKQKMEPAPEMMTAVTMGMDDDYEPLDIDEVSEKEFNARLALMRRPQ